MENIREINITNNIVIVMLEGYYRLCSDEFLESIWMNAEACHCYFT